MKFLKSLFLSAATLCALPSALAEWKNLTLEEYQLSVTGYSDIIEDLDKALPVKSVKDVLADTNHKNPNSSPDVKNAITTFTWESVDGYDDANTKKWYPQGITTSADATDSGDYGGDVVTLVSWHSDNYDDGKRGPRISFINMNEDADRAYRNVLLVVPKSGGDEPDFEALARIHAGGMFWYGDFLYVASTSAGLRVFDLRHIYEVSSGDGIGRVEDGYQAFNYKYVLPQVRAYRWQSKDDVKDFRFSFIALDKTSNPPSMIAGEYSPDTPNRLVHFDLDESNHLLQVNDDGIATSSRAVSHELTKFQGALTIDNKYYMTQSGGSLWTFSWLDGEEEHKDVFTGVPEDLSYQAGYGLWTQMEPPGDRHVIALDLEKF